MDPHPVVVGIRSRQPELLDTARMWALLLDRPLRVVHAFVLPAYASEMYLGEDVSESFEEAAQAVVDDAVEALAMAGTPTESAAVWGPPTAVLAAESKSAELMVIGADQPHWLQRALHGAVAQNLGAEGASPVLIVPDGAPATLPSRIVVLVDEDAPVHRLLAFAFDIAARADAELEIVHLAPENVSAREREQRYDTLVAMLHTFRKDYRDVEVAWRLVTGSPRGHAADVVSEFDLVVVGQPLHATVIGIGHAVFDVLSRRTDVPVVVVPETGADR